VRPDSTVDVTIDFLAGGAEIRWVKIVIFQDGDPSDMDRGVDGFIEVTSDPFTINNVGNALGNEAGNRENVIRIWGYREDKSPIGSHDFTFLGQYENALDVVVSAKHCIMFAWAPSNYVGPSGAHIETPEQGPDYIPQKIAVPEGVTSISVVTDWSSGPWTHADSNAGPGPHRTGPGGRPNTERQTRVAYQHADYNSEKIPRESFPLNRLIGLWQDAPESDGVVFDIGESVSNVPRSGNFLFLGMHDAFEWEDNAGSGVATIIWNS
jgi:hypothetical protein